MAANDSRQSQALKRSQLETARSQATQLRLQAEVSRLEGMVNKLRRTGLNPEPSDETPDPVARSQDPDDQAIMQLGKYFMTTVEAWILPRPESVFGPCPDVAPNDPARYLCVNPEDLLPYITADLYRVAPAKYHDMIENRDRVFMRPFLRGHKDMRTYTIKVFPWTARIPVDVEKDVEPVLLRYLKWDPDNPQSKYPPWPPLLYPDCVQDPGLLFRNPQLMQLLKGLLFGASTLRAELAAGAQGKKKAATTAAGPRPNALLWNLKQVTPGLMALAAVAATYILSADQEFVPMGKKTKINYWERYRTYKKTLVTTARTPDVQKTIQAYQEYLFPKTRAGQGSNHDSGDDYEDPADEMIKLMLARAGSDAPLSTSTRAVPIEASRLAGPAGAPASAAVLQTPPHIPEHLHSQGWEDEDGAPFDNTSERNSGRVFDGGQPFGGGQPAVPPKRAATRVTASVRPPSTMGDIIEDAYEYEDDGLVEDNDNSGYIEIDDSSSSENEFKDLDLDDATDGEIGVPSDHEAELAPSRQSLRPQGSIGLPIAPRALPAPGANSGPRDYSHRLNSPPMVQSSRPVTPVAATSTSSTNPTPLANPATHAAPAVPAMPAVHRNATQERVGKYPFERRLPGQGLPGVAPVTRTLSAPGPQVTAARAPPMVRKLSGPAPRARVRVDTYSEVAVNVQAGPSNSQLEHTSHHATHADFVHWQPPPAHVLESQEYIEPTPTPQNTPAPEPATLPAARGRARTTKRSGASGSATRGRGGRAKAPEAVSGPATSNLEDAPEPQRPTRASTRRRKQQ
ncbi:hypothetical protein C8Q77DRAFT_1073538 [Trametes polyzona]|nr:hypothetical protein C8Q77DRAFT_1073538 [Trametes polyzona]